MSDITFKHHDPNVMLELWHVTKRFGGLTAVGDVSFKIKKGEIYALIGPNGAGKTTIFNLITGVYALTEGRVIFDGTVVGQGDAIGQVGKLLGREGRAARFVRAPVDTVFAVVHTVVREQYLEQRDTPPVCGKAVTAAHDAG